VRRSQRVGLPGLAVLVACAVLPACGDSGSVHAYCSAVEAHGGSGATFGRIPTFYRKAQLLADVEDKLVAMGDTTPPAEIAEPWARQRNALLQVQAAANQLPEGQSLRASPEPAELVEAQDSLTKYWFAHCEG
jgi:hypothetical protein